MSDSTVLSAEGVWRSYDDGERRIEVLRGLDLSVEAGRSVGIVGESGVGKSTLLHVLGALDPCDDGCVSVAGRVLAGLDSRELAQLRSRDVGFVFQFHHLLGDFDAVENVMMPLLIGGQSRGRARKRATEVLEQMGLGQRLDHRPGELSGGEQQRVAVARAVVHRPRLLIADEPTGNLDPASADGVQRLLVEMSQEVGCALVVATHSRTLAFTMTRTLRLTGGVLEEETAGA
jgi:lipoprotein-releasing system ATP-binding protein